MSVATTMVLLDVPRSRERSIELVRRRSLVSVVRERLGRGDPSVVDRELYWPIALVRATASGTGRRQWRDQVLGAVDLVSGRIGIVDVDLPPTRELTAAEGDLIPARMSRTVAERLWHEWFRDHTDRRRKPMRPPALSVDQIERVWLPNHLVTAGGRRFLVDPMVGRVEDLRNVPSVEQLLSDQTDPRTEGATTCKA
ncbi:hypothetical protein [Ornithinimicrobium cavernae]|uniref:hypothetical protein n=1 Tax=Ornithinimicrobium cavernae TaxID=2666047 RepID=UPI0012B16412|nr:hypothetical protein [Ornithinimicrobium cavernae]